MTQENLPWVWNLDHGMSHQCVLVIMGKFPLNAYLSFCFSFSLHDTNNTTSNNSYWSKEGEKKKEIQHIPFDERPLMNDSTDKKKPMQ